MKLAKAALLAPALLLALAATAAAQPAGKAPAKPPRACGVSAIPLAPGNEWTYEPSPPPPDRTLTDAQVRLTPVQPKKLVIKVTGVETKDGVTTVSLSEDLDGKVHTTTVRCTPGGTTFSISPEAFWFAGEPGTSFGLELSELDRKGQTLNLAAGKITGLEWRDDLNAKWKHTPTGKATPKLRSGTVAVKRHWVVLPEEKVMGKSGEWKAIKLGLETLLEVTIEPPTAQPLKAPPLLVNFLWMVDGVGPVQVLNSYGQQYLLTSFVAN